MVKRQHSGHFVPTSGLRKIAGLTEGHYDLIVVDRSGRPVSHLTEWYCRRKELGPNRTRNTYLSMLCPVMGFYLDRGYAWNAPPEQVRIHLRELLLERVACQVRPDQERDGYWVTLSGKSPLSQSGLGVLLAALRDFYQVMIDAGYYPYPNPLVSQMLQQWRRERMRLIAHAGAPDHAGIRGESWEESFQHPTSYFRHRKVWKPEHGMDTQTRQRMNEALAFMVNHASYQRDIAVLLLLYHTGARFHEVLGMAVGSYRKTHDPHKAYLVNKGSQGREEKLIFFPDTAEHTLSRYIQGERVKQDRFGRTQLAVLDETDAVFLVRGGKPFSDAAFRARWRPLMKRVEARYHVTFTPHALRHLFVTNYLAWVKEQAPDNPEEQRKMKEGLRLFMGWRSRRTMEIYDHTFSAQEALLSVARFQQESEQFGDRIRISNRLEVPVAAVPSLASQEQEQIDPPDNAFTRLWENLP